MNPVLKAVFELNERLVCIDTSHNALVEDIFLTLDRNEISHEPIITAAGPSFTGYTTTHPIW